MTKPSFAETMITFGQYVYAECDYDFLEVTEEHVSMPGKTAAPRVNVYARTTGEMVLGYSEYELLGVR